mgnify:CR=1 FL=1
MTFIISYIYRYHTHRSCSYVQVKVNVRVVPGATNGAIALEAQRVKATWVILDRQAILSWIYYIMYQNKKSSNFTFKSFQPLTSVCWHILLSGDSLVFDP